jgi:hypothetical protein
LGRECSTKEEKRNVNSLLVGEPEGKGPLKRPRHIWVDSIKMDIRAVGLGGMNWIHLDQDRDQ